MWIKQQFSILEVIHMHFSNLDNNNGLSSTVIYHHVNYHQQPSRASKPKSSLKHDSAIGQHLLDNPECAKAYSENCFRIIGRARSTFHLAILESVYIKTKNPQLCRQKDFVFALGLLN